LSYLDQIANFIEQNTAAVQLGGPNNQYVDPYTGASPNFYPCHAQGGFSGASRYIEPEAGAQVGGDGSYVDPYTGSSRYVPPPDTGSRDVGAGNVDPYSSVPRRKSVLPVVRGTPLPRSAVHN
jgi:hypothetical protein